MAVVKNMMVRVGADFSSLISGSKQASSATNAWASQTKSDFSSVASASSSFSGAASGINTFTSAFAKLKTAAVALGIGTFIHESIEAASDLTEVQNVVDKAFGNMSGQAEEFAQTAIKQFGLTELQAKQFSANFMAMGKSMGLLPQQAADMAIDLTGMAGDAASFFNLDQEDAYTKLKSIYTGETESLKELGVVMTEDNLKAYALAQGITTSYSAMSQGEKVALRYGYVMDALSYAQGDFADTSNQWANNVRVLKNQFTSLIAVLGKGFIAIANPVVTALNGILSRLVSFSNSVSDVFSSVFGTAKVTAQATLDSLDTSGLADSVNSALGSVGDSGKDAAKGASSAAEELKRTVMGFDEINKMTDNTSGSGSGSSGSGGSPGGGATSSSSAAAANGIFDEAAEKAEKFSGIFADLHEFLTGLNWTPLQTAWDKLKSAGEDLGEVISGGLYWGYENVLKPLAKWSIEEAVPRIIELLANNFVIWNDILTIMQPGAQWLWENFLAPLAKETADTFTAGIDGLNIALEAMHGSLKDIIKVMDGDMTFEELVNKWLEPIDDNGYDYSNIKPLDKEEVRKALGGQGNDKSFDLIGFIFGEAAWEDTMTTLKLFGTDIANFFTVDLPQLLDPLTFSKILLGDAFMEDTMATFRLFGTNVANFFTVDLPQLLDPLNLVRLIFGDTFLEDTKTTLKLFGEDIVTFFTEDIPSLIDNGLENTLKEIELFSPENIDKALKEVIGDNVLEFAVSVKNEASTWWNNVKGWWSDKVGDVESFTTNVKNGASTWWSNVKSWWSGKVGNVASFATNVKNNASTWWSNVKSWWSSKVGNVASFSVSVKNDASTWWKNVKGWWSKKVGTLTTKMTLKVPKVSVTWGKAKKLGVTIPWPKFNIKWNAKGGILDGAQIFGMMGKTLLGGGEAGREAILPLERNTGWMDTIADKVSSRVNSGSSQPIYITVVSRLDGREVARNTVKHINAEARATGVNPLSATI